MYTNLNLFFFIEIIVILNNVQIALIPIINIPAIKQQDSDVFNVMLT